ncbi:MAG: hypothetical protein J0H83_17360 [Candidatus Melainabacteria bacterium]|nr:hypothetical protein [Candidatus Melainabacteria bacterium]
MESFVGKTGGAFSFCRYLLCDVVAFGKSFVDLDTKLTVLSTFLQLAQAAIGRYLGKRQKAKFLIRFYLLASLCLSQGNYIVYFFKTTRALIQV